MSNVLAEGVHSEGDSRLCALQFYRKENFNTFCVVLRVMPPRKRKLHLTVENVSVKNKKKKTKKRDHVHATTTSTESKAETTYQAKNSNADTATLTMGHSEPPALQSLSYESGQRPVTLPLSSGLQSTISSVTLNGECGHVPLQICTFNDSDIFISEASKQNIWN